MVAKLRQKGEAAPEYGKLIADLRCVDCRVHRLLVYGFIGCMRLRVGHPRPLPRRALRLRPPLSVANLILSIRSERHQSMTSICLRREESVSDLESLSPYLYEFFCDLKGCCILR